MTMFNSMYYKCVLVQKLTRDEAKSKVGYGLTISVNGNILFRMTVSKDEEVERGGKTVMTDITVLIVLQQLFFPHSSYHEKRKERKAL